MDEFAPVADLLAFMPMPKLAAALRDRKDRILTRWNRLVTELLPDADVLTVAQVRNSIPHILDQMAKALEASDPPPTDQLMEATGSHGAIRFHESYNMKELIVEYRILRRVLVEETDLAYSGTVTTKEWMALDIAVDISMQQAVLSFMDHQTARLTSATAAEAKFLAFVAHDMRNSLNSILLTMQWVEHSIVGIADFKDQVGELRNARGTAKSTIESMERMLQAERLHRGVTPRRERVSLHDIAREIVITSRPPATRKSLTLESQVPAEAALFSDGGLIRVILQNLVSNAIKYSQKGAITVSAMRVEDQKGAAWHLSVKDQGVGIAPEKVTQLFQAFTRGDTYGQPGVGLGLYIAAQAAKILGSALKVDSAEAQGSTFHLLLHDLPEPE